MTPIAGGPNELALSLFESFFSGQHEFPYISASTMADDIGIFFPGVVCKGPLLLVPVKTEAHFDRYDWTQLEIKAYEPHDVYPPRAYACLALTSNDADSEDSVVEIPVRSFDTLWDDERGEGILSIYLFSKTRAVCYEFPFPKSAVKIIMEYERCPD